jgi:predicted lipoprotein with Yx(FWY)xxD motif
VALVALVLTMAAAAVALAAGASSVVKSSSNSTLGETVVVSAQGRTLYALSPETTRHLLCKSTQCLSVWPPLTVSSRKAKLKAGSGVHGSLGILTRSNGALQVTLRGLPLYRYSGDSGKGQANGQGIKSFGGTWRAATATAGSSKTPATKPSAPQEPASPEPAYPSY